MSELREIAELKEELSEKDAEIERLQEKISSLHIKLRELKKKTDKQETLADIDWEQITLIFNNMKNITQMISFLRRLIREKCICQNNKCEVFPLLTKVDLQRLDMKGIEDPETAFNAYPNKLEYKLWYDQQYIPILREVYKIFNVAYHVGTPNETKEEKVHLEQNMAHSRVMEQMDKVEHKSMHVNFGTPVDAQVQADQTILFPTDPQSVGGNEGIWNVRNRVYEQNKRLGGVPANQLTTDVLINELKKRMTGGQQ